jgi:predicted ABC-type exoprotein transport system permease subunit
MKALIVFLVVIILGFGFVQFVNWLVAEPPTHVFHVSPSGASTPK